MKTCNFKQSQKVSFPRNKFEHDKSTQHSTELWMVPKSMTKKYAVHTITFIILVSYTKTKPILPKNSIY